MKYLKLMKIGLFLLFVFQVNLGYSQTKNDSLLCNIQDKIYSEFTTSFRANSISGLIKIDSIMKVNKNDSFSLYWSSYCQYYQSLFFLKMGQRELSEKKINSAIQTLDTLNDKNSEEYALLAFLQSFSLQFRNSGDIDEWSKKINYNGQKSVDINSKNLRGWYVLGNSDLHLPASYGGGTKCEKYLLKAISLNERTQENCSLPSWGKSESYYALISYYIVIEKNKKAKKTLKKALEKYPDDYMINKLKEKLKDE